jgi:hypothetical protein
VYEESGHFKFEMLRLAWDRWARCLVTDRFISDFSTAWRHLPHDENGITGSVPPQAWTDAYLKLQQQHKDALGNFTLPNSGVTGAINATTGDMTLQGQMGNMVISHLDLLTLISEAMRGKPSVSPPGTPGNPTAGVASTDDRPQLKEHMERNLKQMEAWARASSKSYPRNT